MCSPLVTQLPTASPGLLGSQSSQPCAAPMEEVTTCCIPNGVVYDYGDAVNYGSGVRRGRGIQPGFDHFHHFRRRGVLDRLSQWIGHYEGDAPYDGGAQQPAPERRHYRGTGWYGNPDYFPHLIRRT